MKSRIFNLKRITKKLNNKDWQQDIYDDDMEIRSIYIGTCFDLLPSGKFCMPYDCRKSSYEDEDNIWYERAEEELNKIGCFLVLDETNPCDFYVTERRGKLQEAC